MKVSHKANEKSVAPVSTWNFMIGKLALKVVK